MFLTFVRTIIFNILNLILLKKIALGSSINVRNLERAKLYISEKQKLEERANTKGGERDSLRL